ncbi:MAG: hypothetical protein R3F61_27080 [Myxococcota bacterium]
MIVAGLAGCAWLLPEPPEIMHALDAGDRAVVIDARDLQLLYPGLVPADEEWEKSSQGPHWQVAYASLGDTFVGSFFILDPHPEALMDMGYIVGQMGWRFQERPELVTVGDAYTCGLIVDGGVPIGNACAVLQGDRLWTLIVETRPVTAPGGLDPLFAEALATGAGYTPRPSPLNPGASP